MVVELVCKQCGNNDISNYYSTISQEEQDSQKSKTVVFCDDNCLVNFVLMATLQRHATIDLDL